MAFSLGDLFKGFGSKDTSVVGLDIGASSIKVVQLRASRGTAILETYGEIALGPYNKEAVGRVVRLTPEKVSEALADLMREANVTARTGGLSIPFSSSLISVISLPKVDRDSLKRIMPIEARKYIPVPVSEVTLDWSVIPKEEGQDSAFDRVNPAPNPQQSGMEVLLVAIQNTVLQNYREVTKQVGVAATFYEIEIFSAIRASTGHGLAPIVIVDLGASTTKMYVVERGIVRLTHQVTVGGQHMSETLARSMGWEFDKAERIKRERGLIDSNAYSSDENEKIKAAMLSTLTRIFSETNRVLLNYGQRYNKNVAHVILTGGGASLPGLREVAHSSLNAEVEISDPFSRTEAPAFLSTVLKEIGPGFSVAVGLALRMLKHD